MDISIIELDQPRRLQELYRFRISSHVKTQISRSPNPQPLLQQFVPAEAELDFSTEEDLDPLQEDSEISPLPNLVHKYINKALFLVNDNCPVYCRFCTRKRRTLKRDAAAVYDDAAAIKYIESQPQINEVILSGGDPLMLSAEKLQRLLEKLVHIQHVKFLRIHSRVITTLPARITESLCHFLKQIHTAKPLALVLHINHSSELDERNRAAISLLQRHGLTLYSQSVLLKNINDCSEQLTELFTGLSALNVQPYYLHQLDRVRGSTHFYVEEQMALEIMRELRQKVPPYMLPRFVQDSKQGKKNLFY